MIYKQAEIQLSKMDPREQARLANRVAIFSASERNLITHFNRHGIMVIISLNK